MQTFLPFPDFARSAKVLDNKRLGKQRIEAKQILEINILKSKEFIYECKECHGYFPEENNWFCPNCKQFGLYKYRSKDIKFAWENHPAVLMWRGYEYSLALYGFIICDEWKRRGFIDNQQEFFQKILDESNIWVYWSYNPPMIDINYFPNWYKDSLNLWKLCLSHQSNLLRKDWNYYIKYFGENIQDSTLSYYWPVRK